MFKKMLGALVISGLLAGQGWAKEEHHGEHHGGGEIAQLKGIVKNILQDNKRFVDKHKAGYFKPFTEKQSPRATVVTCSDSRVHTHALDKTPDGDLFMVRNIGNQMSTAEGSVEYGVHHLHTPLLIFVGHSACGAIKAASGDYSGESATIKRELDTIKIDKGVENMAGVKTNVNNQVAAAMQKFDEEIKEGKLTVIGAVYDFRNDLKQGQGKLVIINLNGETDEAKLKQAELLKIAAK
ncbi:MAG: carbonic anhydrase [Pseudomonadota bacterium]